MNESIINSIFAIGGTLFGIILTLLGIVITLFIHKRERDKVIMTSEIKNLARQTILFYDLEREYINEWINQFPDENKETIKKIFRKKVSNNNEGQIIEMTDTKAKKILSKYC